MVREDESQERSQDLPLPIESCLGKGFLDSIEGEPLPIVRLFGWFAHPTIPLVALSTDRGRHVQPLTVSRMHRPDVLAAGESSLPFSGFRVDFLLEDGEQPTTIEVEQKPIYRFPPDSRYASISPHYSNFFTQDAVMGRDAIYGSGPPTDVSAEFKEFAGAASGEVLDFGCGNGDLLSYLRNRGAAAAGLELDETRVRQALKPEAEPYVTFYPGGTPLPFEEGSFDWIVSTEVIEHVPDVASFVPEFARILRADGKLLVTTPDITSIPSSFSAGCVPWHLLEATHINFFTPQSVIRLFARYFVPESMYCLGATRINGLFVPGSIGAIFALRP